MSAALLATLLILFVSIGGLVFALTGRHSDRGPRHRLHRPCPYHDRIRHLIAPRSQR